MRSYLPVPDPAKDRRRDSSGRARANRSAGREKIMVSFVVAYPAAAGATFDIDYYLGTHMPLVHAHLGPHGLTGARVMLPDQPDAPYAAITTLDFRDEAAFVAATTAPEAATVFADVPNFTSITPVTMKARSA